MAAAHSYSPLKKFCVGLCLLFYTAHLFFQVSSEEFRKKPLRMSVKKNILDFTVTACLATMPLTLKVSTISSHGWVLCKECEPCFPHGDLPIYNPKIHNHHVKVGCQTNYCQSTPIHECVGGECNVILHNVDDDGILNGTLSTQRLRFVVNQNIVVLNFLFACIHRADGGFEKSSVGSISLTKHPRSLVSQMSAEKFAYCLPTQAEEGWVTFNHSVRDRGPNSITAPLVNPESYLYKVRITSFEVQNHPIIEITPPNDVFTVSSSTAVTFVDPRTFKALKHSIEREVTYPIADGPFSLCYNVGEHGSIDLLIKVKFGEHGSIDLWAHNCFVKVSDSMGCFVISQTSKGGPILGSMAQAGRQIIFALSTNTITFGHDPTC